MRPVTVFGVVVALAIATMASVGAVAAQADNEVVICKTSETLCALSNQYPAKTVVKNLGTAATFLGSISETCKHTEYTFETLAQMGDPLPISITQFEFTGCQPCTTVKAENLPYTSNISMDQTSGEYLVKVSGMRYTMSGCSLNAKCTFAAESVTFSGSNGELKPETRAKAVKFSLVEGLEGLCGGSSSIDAVWFVTNSSTYFSLYEL